MSTTGSLPKTLGFWSATSLVVGSIIGSGVFMKPSTMAAQLGSPLWLSLVWVLGGMFSLFGALVYAELGAMMPETGGIYVYFRKMFGEFVAYLYGWSAFSVINTASVAAIAFVCAAYADYFLQLPHFSDAMVHSHIWHIPLLGDLYPLKDFGIKAMAVLIVAALTMLNYFSLKAGSWFQNISTLAKILVLGALVFGIFFSGEGTVRNFWEPAGLKTDGALVSGIIAAMTGAFFAYDGWINIASVAGEVKQPRKNIPRSLWLGVLICILVYLAVNQAFLYAMPVDKLAASSLVASDAIGIAWGRTGEALVAAMIVISTMGCINGNILAPCRITYAMGKDKIFYPSLGREHKKFQTPANALLLHGAWSSLLIFSGSFDLLADMFVFITWLAYGLGALGIFLLRIRMPETERPYRIWGHPVVTFTFICFTAFFLLVTLRNDILNYTAGRQPVINSLLGLLITAIGIPFYFYFRRKNRRKGQPPGHP